MGPISLPELHERHERHGMSNRLEKMKNHVEVYLKERGPKKLTYPSEEVAAVKEAILEVVAEQLDAIEKKASQALSKISLFTDEH